MELIFDAFGGDNAPASVIDGIILAMKDSNDFSAILVGDETILNKELASRTCDMSRISIVHAPEIITCNEQPTIAIKRKKQSSIVVAMNMMASHEGDCLISAGSTGAVLTGATLLVRRIEGVLRPALAPMLPTLEDPVLLLDCGANADCKPEYLSQFAIMGSAYMKGVRGLSSPRVGLINNGTEETKGNTLTKAAYDLIKKASISFVGNCEAREIFSGDFDVLVCDGFTGNIVLKEAEGLANALFKMLKTELMSSVRSKLGAKLSKPAFSTLKKRMDYKEYGGAPLLGINGGIIKAHGNSDAKTYKSAIHQARSYVNGNITEMIRNGISN